MKKTILLLGLSFTVFFMNGQNTWSGLGLSGDAYRFGDVGIGTSNPTEKLDVNGTVKADKGNFNQSLPNGAIFSSITQRNTEANVLRAGTELSGSGSIFNVLDIPSSNLNTQAISLIGVEDRNYRSRWRFTAYTSGMSQLRYYDKIQSVFYDLSEDGNGNVFLQLPKHNSYVSIGTDSFGEGTDLFKLSVHGRMRAESVKVYTDWADFVFEDDYNLPTLQEVEDFINKNGHLKDIPSAAEVAEEGIDVGEMNKLLLQKVEELTLYMIELQKEIEVLKSQR